VLFCDLTGSTALGETLDPERLRALLANYFERMKAMLGGRRDEALAALEIAVERYARKGNLVSAQRARARLARA
jgi:class 3 adenylate cyclase